MKRQNIYGASFPREIGRLYNQVLEKKPETNDSGYDFDTGRFNQYMDAFIDEVRELD